MPSPTAVHTRGPSQARTVQELLFTNTKVAKGGAVPRWHASTLTPLRCFFLSFSLDILKPSLPPGCECQLYLYHCVFAQGIKKKGGGARIKAIFTFLFQRCPGGLQGHFYGSLMPGRGMCPGASRAQDGKQVQASSFCFLVWRRREEMHQWREVALPQPLGRKQSYFHEIQGGDNIF